MDLINPFIVQDAVQQAYNNDMTASGFGTGGKYQQAIQAATAAVQGLAGGNLSAALADGAAPYIAEIIKQTPGRCGACGSPCRGECCTGGGTGK